MWVVTNYSNLPATCVLGETRRTFAPMETVVSLFAPRQHMEGIVYRFVETGSDLDFLRFYKNSAERDAYYTVHPENLVEGAMCVVGSVTPVTSVYTNGAWINGYNGIPYFDDEAARDAFYVQNPDELVDGATCLIGPNAPVISIYKGNAWLLGRGYLYARGDVTGDGALFIQ